MWSPHTALNFNRPHPHPHLLSSDSQYQDSGPSHHHHHHYQQQQHHQSTHTPHTYPSHHAQTSPSQSSHYPSSYHNSADQAQTQSMSTPFPFPYNPDDNNNNSSYLPLPNPTTQQHYRDAYSPDPIANYHPAPTHTVPSIATTEPSFPPVHTLSNITPWPPNSHSHARDHDDWSSRAPTWQTDIDNANGSTKYHTQAQSTAQATRLTKNKERESQDVWTGVEDEDRDTKRARLDDSSPVNIELDIAQLQTYLTELLGYIHTFVPTSDHPVPSQPPPYLHTRFTKLSDLIHNSLLRLAPHVHPTLLPGFTITPAHRAKSPSKFPALPSRLPPPTKKFEDMSPAEKEMEVIRQRRDALIAKAASALAAQGPATTLSPATHAIVKSETPHAPSPRRHMSGSAPVQPPAHTYGGRNMVHMNDYDNSHNGTLGLLGNLVALTEASELASQAQARARTYASMSTSEQNGFELNSSKIPMDKLIPDSMAVIGRCHGCGASVTNQWQRGPDGPDSLCAPCGMHYAKLVAKKERFRFGGTTGASVFASV